MILGWPLITVKGYCSGTRRYTSEGSDKILKCHGRKKSGSVKFSTVLLCKVLCFFRCWRFEYHPSKKLDFWKQFFSLMTTVLQALREISDRFAKNAQFLLHIFYLGGFKLLRNLALCHYSHLCRKNKRRKQETCSRNRPSTQRQFSSHFTGRGMDLKFLCFQVPLNCVLELIVGIKSLVTSMPSRSTHCWERSKMYSLKV